MPGPTASHQLLVDVLVADMDSADQPTVATAAGDFRAGRLAEGQVRQGLLGAAAEGLPQLRGVDASQADAVLGLIDQEHNVVTITDPDDLAFEGFGTGLGSERQEERERQELPWT